jgi:hypothetical protein
MVSVEVAEPLLVSDGLGETEQVRGGAAAQPMLTVPENPLTDVALMTSVPLPVEPLVAMGTMVVLGTSEKSASGLEMELPLFSVVAEGA